MADLVPVVGSFRKVDSDIPTTNSQVNTGVTVTICQVVIKSGSGISLAENDTVDNANFVGFAFANGDANKGVDHGYRLGKIIDIGVSLSEGLPVFLSNNAGNMTQTLADVTTGKVLMQVGIGTPDGKLMMSKLNLGTKS